MDIDGYGWEIQRYGGASKSEGKTSRQSHECDTVRSSK